MKLSAKHIETGRTILITNVQEMYEENDTYCLRGYCDQRTYETHPLEIGIDGKLMFTTQKLEFPLNLYCDIAFIK